jgi:integrase
LATKRRKGTRLDNEIVEALPFAERQYSKWDRVFRGCGVRVSAGTKACVISVWLGGRQRFETIGRISTECPYETLRESAWKRLTELKKERLPRAPLRLVPGNAARLTLRDVLSNYSAAHPQLRSSTVEKYKAALKAQLAAQMDQPPDLLTAKEILRLNQERLSSLAQADPDHRPPRGFYGWQTALRTLRSVITWHAATQNRPSPWPESRALKLVRPPPRRLPVELQTVEGRRRLVEGLKQIDSWTSRATLFLCYTGLRRGEATSLVRANLIQQGVVEFESKTRELRVPLSSQALDLLDTGSGGTLLHVGEHAVHKPLIKIFGYRETARGNKPCVSAHDLRRYFKTVGTELGIDPTVMNLLVGHSIKGVDAHYIAKIRLSVLRTAAQRIADEIDNPQETADDELPYAKRGETEDRQALIRSIAPYLASADVDVKTVRYAHYLTREGLHELVWSAPLTTIAQRIGVSDVAIAKACRRAAIPVPARGYWAKIDAGQLIAMPSLPKLTAGMPGLVRIAGTHPPGNSNEIRTSNREDLAARTSQSSRATF